MSTMTPQNSQHPAGERSPAVPEGTAASDREAADTDGDVLDRRLAYLEDSMERTAAFRIRAAIAGTAFMVTMFGSMALTRNLTGIAEAVYMWTMAALTATFVLWLTWSFARLLLHDVRARRTLKTGTRPPHGTGERH